MKLSLIHLILHSQSHPSDVLSRLLYLWNLPTYPTDLLQTPIKILQSSSLILPYSLWTLCSATLHLRQCLSQIIFLIQYSILQPCYNPPPSSLVPPTTEMSEAGGPPCCFPAVSEKDPPPPSKGRSGVCLTGYLRPPTPSDPTSLLPYTSFRLQGRYSNQIF